ncbi:hypothetical protein [Chondrinema litorale]|uniref:hypothetical protein n=1 Tax=Chondrinema litorale TaxID=2994555 RepID=UPI00254368AB|nr:hypothetical protein [Chondrinema litorale]UZR98576.1 hypothetical protein OQ292_32630 [Chondrinema litorale]
MHKRILICLIIIMVQAELLAQVQPVKDSTTYFIHDDFKKEKKRIIKYFGASSLDRIIILQNHIQKLEKNNIIGLGDESKFMIFDLETLSNESFSYAFFLSGGWGGSYYSYKFENLDHQFELWKNALAKRPYLKSNDQSICTVEVAYYYNHLCKKHAQ